MSTTELTGTDEEKYLRGHTDGFTWARDFATPDELRDVGVNSAPDRAADPYWQGFAAGVEEIQDERL